ncbi:benzoate 1,2-dioxygenase subunit alpha [Caballeronia udeis]|uniref:Benzoate 1,2-dioxygenase subunit alpha n=1 Tax=Caballeronia udeis TaxID=1232866 RepID=A0A158JIL7_9BURK|nr:aromatic ring-hydroxylating dioxygenase subunit alpha [Caballeronia udeis]SAL68674.1 benzoate 1,2-dioxygenase subunit alpha [Caballeronia udeis]
MSNFFQSPIATIPSDTTLADLIVDNGERGQFKVHRSVFRDDGILALERDRIFDRCWLYMGHASELPAAQSFVRRMVGGRDVLLTRTKTNEFKAFFNSCSHRGAQVCREAAGRKSAFQCPYHGWVYDSDGRLVNVPGRDAVPESFNDDGSMNLKGVPRLDAFRDFIFICFDSEVTSLSDYLADAKPYLEYVADQGAQGMEIVGGTQEYSSPANWKLLQENSADGYHGATTHASYLDYLKTRDGAAPQFDPALTFGNVRDLGNGHAVAESVGNMPWGRPYARWVPGFGEDARAEIEQIERETLERLGAERGEVVTRGDRNLLIFPNLVINDIMAITIRTFYPIAPGRIDINAWALAPRAESAASRDRRLKNYLEFLGPAGFATPDDVEMLEMCQRGYENVGGNEWNDLSRGMLRDKPFKSDELQMRVFWRRWRELMSRTPREGVAR